MRIVFNRLGPVFFAGLLMGLCGCAAYLYDPPAAFKPMENQPAFPALRPDQVYFFLSKDAFPPDLQAIPMGTLFTPEGSQWSEKKLVEQFQIAAAGVGANAIIIEGVQTSNMSFGFLYYTGYATAYRLYKGDSSVNVDLSQTDYGTQDPDMAKVNKNGVLQKLK